MLELGFKSWSFIDTIQVRILRQRGIVATTLCSFALTDLEETFSSSKMISLSVQLVIIKEGLLIFFKTVVELNIFTHEEKTRTNFCRLVEHRIKTCCELILKPFEKRIGQGQHSVFEDWEFFYCIRVQRILCPSQHVNKTH